MHYVHVSALIVRSITNEFHVRHLIKKTISCEMLTLLVVDLLLKFFFSILSTQTKDRNTIKVQTIKTHF